jgi:hypothetical protein
VGLDLSGGGQATGTIANPNALPQAAISGTTVTASPGEPTTAAFTVTLNAPSSQPVTLTYATTDGTARAGFENVAVAAGTLTLAPGQTALTVPLTVNAAPADAVKKTYGIRLTTSTGALLPSGQATITIVHATFGTNVFSGDASKMAAIAPYVSVGDAMVTAAAGGPTDGTLTISLRAKSNQAVSVSYTTVDGTAKAGSDYVAVPNTPLSIAPGQDHQSLAVMVFPRPRYDLPRSFTILLTAAPNAIIADSRATVTIDNPNPPPTVSIADVAVTASPGASTTASFSVSLSAPSDATTTVNYATAAPPATAAGGPALAGTDYTAASGTLTFDPGETQKTIAVTVKAAPRYDVSKTFGVTLSAATNASIATGQGQATGTINNPNPVPSLSIVGVTVTASATGTTTANFIVALSAVSNVTTTVNYDTAAMTAHFGVDYDVTAGTATFRPGTNRFLISVPIHAEPAGGSPKTFLVKLSNPVGATIAIGQATGTINATPLPPRFTVSMAITSGKGKKKKITGEQLFFSAPLDTASAQTATHYQVTQAISRRKTTRVPVVAAKYSAGNNSVTLTLGGSRPGKPLMLTVSGLRGAGAGGLAVAPFSTKL